MILGVSDQSLEQIQDALCCNSIGCNSFVKDMFAGRVMQKIAACVA